VRVEFTDFPPTGHDEATVRALLGKWKHLVPRWCGALTVRYAKDGLESEALAEVNVRHEYRDAEITITSRFFFEGEDEQARVLRHELGHILVAPLAAVLGRVVNANRDDDSPWWKFVVSEADRCEEMVVEDFADVTGQP